ncbi:hypothetical protein [Streptomyces sp. NPDC096153]|uniref:hypothetical protein n=1 Tax=Streptomyces sp. NPDC096153 TaxID=3155548 RepID=UPI0033310C17
MHTTIWGVVMQGRWEKLKQRGGISLFVLAVGLGIFFFVGSASQAPSGWGAAYAAGKPVTVQLSSSCRIETVGDGKSTGRCEGTKWTVDGRSHTGTLYAYGDDITRSADGALTFSGEAKALGDRAYGRPDTWLTVVHLGALGLAAIGILALLGSLVSVILPSRRTA